MLGGLLGQGDPDFLAGAGFSDSPHFMYSGYDKNGEWYQLYSIGFGGIPGKPSGDGPDGHSLWPSLLMCLTNSSRATSRCALKRMKRLQTAVVQAITAAVTVCAWVY